MLLILSQVINVHLVIINFVRKLLENLEPSLSDEIKMALMYTAGYIARNSNQPSEYETYFYYGKYINLIDHVKLKVLFDQSCKWFVLYFSIQ